MLFCKLARWSFLSLISSVPCCHAHVSSCTCYGLRTRCCTSGNWCQLHPPHRPLFCLHFLNWIPDVIHTWRWYVSGNSFWLLDENDIFLITRDIIFWNRKTGCSHWCSWVQRLLTYMDLLPRTRSLHRRALTFLFPTISALLSLANSSDGNFSHRCHWGYMAQVLRIIFQQYGFMKFPWLIERVANFI